MPLFFGSGDSPSLEIALRTENNQHILEYWRDAKNRDMLASLFSATRMQALLPAAGELKETLIYCFTHSVRSHLYFFSATREELLQSGLMSLFFQVGARRPSWRVYKFSLERCDLHEADLASQQSKESPQLQDMLLQERLKQISYVGLLQDVGLDSQREEFQYDASAQHNANELQRFGHDSSAAPSRSRRCTMSSCARRPATSTRRPWPSSTMVAPGSAGPATSRLTACRSSWKSRSRG
ncbi:hypothetical protein FT673_05895 [Aeromonas hydrophila]|nr:hypothetical protein FT673_05895 [Aeromonas hydrophila]